MTKKILISGFTPFGNYERNSSEEILKYLNNRRIHLSLIKTILLPTQYTVSLQKLVNAVCELRPSAIISFGMKAKSDTFTIEQRGRNILQVPLISKVSEKSFSYQEIQPGGANFRNTNNSLLPTKEEFSKNDFPISNSFYAGNYVCNYLIYTFQGYVNSALVSNFPYSFIHIPALKKDCKWDNYPTAGMELELILYEAEFILEAISTLIV